MSPSIPAYRDRSCTVHSGGHVLSIILASPGIVELPATFPVSRCNFVHPRCPGSFAALIFHSAADAEDFIRLWKKSNQNFTGYIYLRPRKMPR